MVLSPQGATFGLGVVRLRLARFEAKLRRTTTRLAVLYGATAIVAVAVLLAALVEVLGVTHVLHDVRLVSDASDVQRDTLTALVDEETGVRGYVATSSAVFLQPYSDGARRLAARSAIPATIALYPRTSAAIAAAQRSEDALQRYFRGEVALVRDGSVATARARLRAGKNLFDEYRRRQARVLDALARLQRRDRQVFDVSVSTLLTVDVAGLVALAVFSALTVGALRTGRQVEVEAARDGLTGLANRRTFELRLRAAAGRHNAAGTPFALAYIDLDGFKAINDTYGHATGDDLLRAVATRLATVIRANDLAARLGGDEFAVLLENVNGERECGLAIARLQAALDPAHNLGGATVLVGCSLGVSLCPVDGLDAAALVAVADARMFEAKAARRAAKGAAAAPAGGVESLHV